jgi:integrase
MTVKNETRLRQLADPELMAALVRLPIEVVKRKSARLKPYRRALEVETALMVQILLMVPLRVGNLARLDLDRHLGRFGKDRGYFVTIPRHEVKNDVELRIPLSDETSRLIDIYISKYRPALLGEPSSALFPGRDGGAKCVRSTSGNISKFLMRELGIAFNAHLFRHLAAYNYLRRFPGDYETVRQLLGHKLLETTKAFYCGLENEAAFRRFSEIITRYDRDHADPRPPRRPK